MKKILIILALILLLNGCSKKDYVKFEDDLEILNDYINIEKDWQKKSGMYGIFYTDYEDFIFINKIDENKDLEYQIYDDINYYLPKHFTAKYNMKLELDGNEFTFYKDDGDYKVSKGKIFKDGEKSIYVLVSVKKGDVNNLYENTFK